MTDLMRPRLRLRARHQWRRPHSRFRDRAGGGDLRRRGQRARARPVRHGHRNRRRAESGRSTTASSRGSVWGRPPDVTCCSDGRLTWRTAVRHRRGARHPRHRACRALAPTSFTCIPTPPAPRLSRKPARLPFFRVVGLPGLEGGVFINCGSAVDPARGLPEGGCPLPERGPHTRSPTTVNLDFLRHYRPQTNVVTRPMAGVGLGLFTRRPSRDPHPAPRGGARGGTGPGDG